MDLKTYSTGIQHIGIPTGDIEKTVEFYKKLGFEIALETVNEKAGKRVVFLKLNTLVIETYDNTPLEMKAGAIDHVAIDVHNVDEVYEYVNENGLNTVNAEIRELPFWDNGVRFFIIEGPNKEKIEFSQVL